MLNEQSSASTGTWMFPTYLTPTKTRKEQGTETAATGALRFGERSNKLLFRCNINVYIRYNDNIYQLTVNLFFNVMVLIIIID